MITNLSLQNFKGATACYAFRPGNLIQGSNFAGKSAIDQAIRALVLGYVPGVAKTASGLKMFASDYPMVVEANVSMKDRYEKPRIAFERGKGNAVKQTADDSLAEFIDEPTRVLFDPSIFFNLSDSARISKACELVLSQGVTPEQIDAALVLAAGEHPTMLRHLKTWRDKIKAPAKTVADLLAASEEFWKGEKKIVAAEKDRMQSTVEGVSDLGAKDSAPLPPRAEVEAARAKLQQEIQELTRTIAAEEAAARTRQQDEQALATLRPAVEGLPAARAQLEELNRKLSAAETEAEKAAGALRAAMQAHEQATSHARELAANARERESLAAEAKQIEALTTQVTQAKEAVAALEKEIAALTTAANDAQADLKKAKEAAAAPRPDVTAQGELRTDDFETHREANKRYLVTAVVYIDADSKKNVETVESWRELHENVEDAEEQARNLEYELTQAVAEAEEAHAAVAEKLQQAEANLYSERNTLTERQEALTRAKVSAERLAKLPVDASVDRTKETGAALAAAQTAATTASTALRTTRQEHSTASSTVLRCEAAEAEVKRIESRAGASAVMGPEALNTLRSNLEEVKTALRNADATLSKVIAAEQDAKRIAEAATKREAVETEIKLLNKLIGVIDQKKAELVSGSIEAPLAIANKLAAGILKGPLAFEEGEIGMRVGDKFVSSRVFSGTETAIVMMGLTAGLAARSALRVLMLDEIGRLDVQNATRLIANLAGMVKGGDIDQFILIGPTDDRLLATDLFLSEDVQSVIGVISL